MENLFFSLKTGQIDPHFFQLFLDCQKFLQLLFQFYQISKFKHFFFQRVFQEKIFLDFLSIIRKKFHDWYECLQLTILGFRNPFMVFLKNILSSNKFSYKIIQSLLAFK